MKNFTFKNPTKIIFGEGQIKTLIQEIPKDSNILITYGGGSIKKNGVYQQVVNALSSYQFQEFGGIEPNPSYETLMKAVEVVKENKIDFLLAVGGGSVIDGTKFISVASNYKGEDAWDIVLKKDIPDSAIPFGTVLTLPATGSEMNSGSVVTKKSTGDKLAFMTPLTFPQFSILDPTTTFTLPSRQISNGIVDAYTHIMEQYLTVRENGVVQDHIAEGLLLTLIQEGPKALNEPTNYNVRSNIMWTATMALNGLIGVGVPQDWSTHMIGHELTAKFGIDHAQTLAIVLPSVMNLRRKKKWSKLLRYAEKIWNINEGTDDQKISLAIDKTRAFFESLGVKTRLSDYKVSEKDLPSLVENLISHNMVSLGEDGEVTPEISEKILRESL